MEKFKNDLNISAIYNHNEIYTHLKDKTINLIVTDTLPSTNTYLKEEYRNLPDKTVLIADYQTAGRGRITKSFYSPAGSGIYMSLLIRNRYSSSDALKITPIAAVAIFDVIKKYCDNASIKWVNDIFIGDKKVCGILTESSFCTDGLTDYIVVGVGLNVFPPKDNFPSDISNIATSLFSDNNYDINLIVAEIINSLICYIDNFNVDLVADKYIKNSYLDGKSITVYNGKNSYDAVVLGINKDFRLIVKKGEDLILLSSGEVSVKANNYEQ